MKPRSYQIDARDAFFYYFENHSGNPLIALPTGTGKSIVIAIILQMIYQRYGNQRILMLTHVKELIEQNADKLLRIWPTAPLGIYSAGLGRKELAPIIYGGIASIAKRAVELGHVDLIFIDEAHLVSPKDDTMYRQLIEELTAINPHLKVVGLTATPYRLGIGCLTEGGLFTDFAFDGVSYEAFNWFLDEGYLVPLIPKRTGLELDITGVKKHGGEFVQKQLQEAVDREEITWAALQETLAQAHDRKHWLIFASGIEHAEHIAQMLDALGVTNTVVHSKKMTNKERDKRTAMFKNGEVRALVNNGVYTTGFDFPELDCIVVLRPTGSPGLWVQMLGRGTRPVFVEGFDLTTKEGRLASIAASQKRDCLVLDFAGNSKRLGPINDPVIPRKKGDKKAPGDVPVRICDDCGTYNHASVAVCCCCGKVFPRSVKIFDTAGTDELIATNAPKIETFKVDRVVYAKHAKPDKPSSLKVQYYCGLRIFNEWVCLEHDGFVQKKAGQWWLERDPYSPVPTTVDEALTVATYLPVPISIDVQVDRKYPEIKGYAFT